MSNNPLVALARQAVGLTPLEITPKRKYLALLLAGLVDVAQATVLVPSTTMGAMSPLEWGVDIATTVLLVAILGWNWRLLAAFAIELIPTAALFPTWSALILTITALSGDKKPGAALPAGAGQPELPQGQPGQAPPGQAPLGQGTLVSPGQGAGDPAKFPGVYHKRTR